MDTSSPPSHSTNDLVENYKRLRRLVHASAISLLILTGTVFIFIYRQVSNVRNNTRDLVHYISEYEESDASEFIEEAHRRFAEFRQQHPDFNSIYLRYFGTNPPPARSSLTNDTPAKLAPFSTKTP